MAERNRAVLIGIRLAGMTGVLPPLWVGGIKGIFGSEKEVKFRAISSITHRRVKMYRRKLGAEMFLNGLAEERNF